MQYWEEDISSCRQKLSLKSCVDAAVVAVFFIAGGILPLKEERKTALRLFSLRRMFLLYSQLALARV